MVTVATIDSTELTSIVSRDHGVLNISDISGISMTLEVSSVDQKC